MEGTGKVRLLAAASLCVLLVAAQPQAARAAGEIESFSIVPSSSQGGGHPDISMSVGFGAVEPRDTPERLTLEWPQGLTLVAPAVTACELADLASGQCTSTSQLGVATIREASEGAEVVLGTVPVFRIASDSGSFARIAFVVPVVDEPVYGDFFLRKSNDYRVSLTLAEFPQAAPLAGLDLKLWGVPASVSNDDERFPTGSSGCPGSVDASCNTPTPSPLPMAPQIENSTACAGLLSATAVLGTYESPGNLVTSQASYPPATGCDQRSFEPTVAVALTTTEVRAPTGLDLDLKVPQTQSPSTPSPSQLRDAEVVFEDGVLLGFGPETMDFCTEIQASFQDDEPPACPSDTRLGTATVGAALFPSPISGDVYYGGEDAFGNYIAYVLASGFGVEIKLRLFAEEDPETGAAMLAFETLPQIPISRITLGLFSSTELLETVNECGDFEAMTEFVPWDDEISSQVAGSEFSLDSGPGGTPCPGPASKVDVSLSPASVFADGVSTTTATAKISDATGGPAVWDEVEFRSSDPGERIGPVTETAEGVYTATITSSTTPGPVTITAVDRSVVPNVTGTATLEQLATAGPAPSGRVPSVKITRHPPRRSRNLRPLFGFTATPGGSTFRCSVDAKPFRRCSSPLRLKRLAPGSHRFRVFAVSPEGSAGRPAIFRFTVLRAAKKPRRLRGPRRSARR